MATTLAALLAIVGIAALAPRLAEDKAKSRSTHIQEGLWTYILLPLPIVLLFRYRGGV
jgi:hypothetical protein